MKRTALATLCVLSSLSSTLAVGNTVDVAPTIINGKVADVKDYPYFASLYYDRTNENGEYVNMCGASILDEYHVLTAAHCVMDPVANLFTNVALGVQNEDDFKQGQLISAHKFYVHPDYINDIEQSLMNDIAIIRLISPITEGDNIKFVKRATASNILSHDDDMVIVGHGKNTPLSDTSVEFEEAQVLYYKKCNNDDGVPESQICITSDVKLDGRYSSACSGDSGGPLLWPERGDITDTTSYVQVGVASYGLKDCGATSFDYDGVTYDVKYSSVYTEVADYDSWISLILSGDEDTLKNSLYFEATEAARQAVRDQESGSSGGTLGIWALFGLGLAQLFRRKSSALA